MNKRKRMVSILAGVMAAVMALTLIMSLVPMQGSALSSSEIRSQINQLKKEKAEIQEKIKEVEGHVPADVAVLLNGEAGTYTLTIDNEDKEGVESLFRGTTLTTTIGSDVNAYILAKHEGDDEPKLYLLDPAERTLAANKAYYVSETSTASFTLKLGTTGIESSLTDETAEPVKYYDLSGRRVLNPTKGLYVTDKGRKVLVK